MRKFRRINNSVFCVVRGDSIKENASARIFLVPVAFARSRKENRGFQADLLCNSIFKRQRPRQASVLSSFRNFGTNMRSKKGYINNLFRPLVALRSHVKNIWPFEHKVQFEINFLPLSPFLLILCKNFTNEFSTLIWFSFNSIWSNFIKPRKYILWKTWENCWCKKVELLVIWKLDNRLMSSL